MRIVKPITITDATLVSSSVPETDYQVYHPDTGYALGTKVILTSSVHKVFEVIKQESSTVTINSSGDALVTWTKHGLTNGRMVKFTSTAALPTGITANTMYYVVSSAQDNFKISATYNGTPVTVSSAGTGTITATAMVNGLNPATNPTYWLDVGSTNRWKMFDKSVQSQTSANGSMTFKLVVNSYLDTIAFLNVAGASINVTITYGTTGVVYNRTVSLTSPTEPVKDLWTYLLAGFKQRRDVVLEDIPPYVGATITVTVTNTNNGRVAIGACLVGLARDISSEGLGVEHGAKHSITDYSIKNRDAFGNYIITERAFSKRANYTVYMKNSEIDDIQNFLTDLRATPTLYLGSRKYSSSYVYGYYKSWEVDIAYPDYSVCTIELDGLT